MLLQLNKVGLKSRYSWTPLPGGQRKDKTQSCTSEKVSVDIRKNNSTWHWNKGLERVWDLHHGKCANFD